ncbi:hypothetical protein GCM10007235_18310 [Pseudoxanthomonas indica]|nr:hypothetical protein GCM10007235_18310 [Pseudoxanthomonas indica]
MLVLQIAVACLLWQMAWQAISQWQQQLTADSGIDEQRVLVVAPLGRSRSDPEALATGMQLIAGVKGVERVARINQVPYGNNSWNTVVRRGLTGTERIEVATSFGDASLFATLGLRVQEGRALLAREYEHPDTIWQQPGELPVVITRALADRVFAGQSAVGRILSGPTRPLRVVGVVAALPIPKGSRQLGVEAQSHIIMPAIADDAGYTSLLVRVAPGHEAEVATTIQQQLVQRFADRPISLPQRLSDLRPATLLGERRCAWTWSLCAVAWSALTLLSLAAAEMLWVQRSAPRISLHRALGASRAQVRGSVHWDLCRLVAAGCLVGVVSGMLLAPRLDLPWKVESPSPVFVVGLVLVALVAGQILATWPARRAAAVAPHHVTRKPWVRL